MMKNVIIIFGLLFGSCGTLQKIENGNSTIVGKWCLGSNEINYPTVTFGTNSMAVFSSRMDTVYTFRYYVQSNKLNLVQPTREINKDRILKLTKDSLVFETLLEHKTKQVYYRCKK